jgi:arylsulfatase A-like enzyme
VVRLDDESAETRRLYGADDPVAGPFARQCLVARRLVERGVRFVQVYHGGAADDDNGHWDSHQELRKNHGRLCAEIDRPVAGLLADLKRRGMLDSTLVVWATEFGRSPNVESRPDGEGDPEEMRGRDHHIFGFTVWLAGGGVKGGVVHGATDELGFHAVEGRHYVTDVHATVLHLLGLDARRLEVPGRKRLDVERGRPIAEILA